MCPTRRRSNRLIAHTIATIGIAFQCATLLGCNHGACSPAPLNFAGFERHEVQPNSVQRTLSAFHDAASRADERAYFDLLADDAIFLGTDATERWTKAEFQAYAHPYFAQGKGWTYTPTKTNITVEGEIAWFDQDLSNEKWGPCRGSGVLRREPSRDPAFRGDVWRITQYNLSVPIPNDLMPEVTQRIRALSK